MMIGLIGAVGQEAKVRTSLSTQGDVYVGQRVTLVVELFAPVSSPARRRSISLIRKECS